MARSALLLLDYQMYLLDNAGLHRREALLDVTQRLLRNARAAEAWVIYMQNCGAAGDADEPGTPGWQLHPAVAPRPGELVMQKEQPDGFVDTPLDMLLQAVDVRELVIAGVRSEADVHDTCRRADDLGYQVTLATDGHSTFDDGRVKAASLVATVNRAIGDVMRVRPASAIRW